MPTDKTIWITPSYRADDRFRCEHYGCSCHDEIRADDPNITWDSTDEFIGPNGSLGPSACCPECGWEMEEVDDGDTYVMSDYQERMHERRQMGFCNF